MLEPSISVVTIGFVLDGSLGNFAEISCSASAEKKKSQKGGRVEGWERGGRRVMEGRWMVGLRLSNCRREGEKIQTEAEMREGEMGV